MRKTSTAIRYLYHQLSVIGLFVLTLNNVASQSIKINPWQVVPSGETTIDIKGTDLSFSTTDTTDCPDKLNVNISNVILQQASNTVTAKSIRLTDANSLSADFNVPDFNGLYSVIIDPKGPCPVKCENCFRVYKPEINVYPSSANKGDKLQVNVFSNVFFSTDRSSICPGFMKVSPHSLSFTNGNTTFTSEVIQADSNNYIDVAIKVPDTAPSGYYDVKMTSEEGDCEVSCLRCFYVNKTYSIEPAPDTVFKGETLPILLSGQNVIFRQASGTANCETGYLEPTLNNIHFKKGEKIYTPSSLEFISDNSIQATVNFPRHAEVGSYDIVVGGGNQCAASCSSCIYVEASKVPVDYSGKVFTIFQPTSVSREYVSVNLLSSEITFSSDESDCPVNLKIGVNEIMLKKDDLELFNNNFYFNDGEGRNTTVTAQFQIPPNFPDGKYDIIAGVNSGCPAICKECFEVGPAPLLLEKSFVPKGGEITLTSNEIQFTNSGPNECNRKLNIESAKIIFENSQDHSLFYASAFSLEANNVRALLPGNIPSGKYNISIVSEDDCRISCHHCLTVDTLAVTPSIEIVEDGHFILGQPKNVMISSSGLLLSPVDSAECNLKYHVSNQTISLIDSTGKAILYPKETSYGQSRNYVADAYFHIPVHLPEGDYKIKISNDNNCSMVSKNSIRIVAPKISVINSHTARQQQPLSLDIISDGFLFLLDSLSECPVKYQITDELVTIEQGTFSFRPYENNPGNYSFSVKSKILVPEEAPLGNYDVIIGKNTACPAVCKNCFTVDSGVFVRNISQADFSENHFYRNNSFRKSFRANVNLVLEAEGTCPQSVNADPLNIIITNYADTIIPEKTISYSDFQIHTYGKIPPTAAYGLYDVIVGQNGSCPLICKNCLEVVSSEKAIVKTVPETGNINEILRVEIVGKNFQFYSGSPADIGAVQTEDIIFQKDTFSFIPKDSWGYLNTLYTTVDIPVNAPLGKYDIHLNYMDTMYTCNDCFTIVHQPTLFGTSNGQRGKITPMEIFGKGIKFTSDAPGKCNFLYNISDAKFTLSKGIDSVAVDSVIKMSENSLLLYYQVPLQLPSGAYNVVVNSAGNCPIVCKECVHITCDSFPENAGIIGGASRICSYEGSIQEYHLPEIKGVDYHWKVSNGKFLDSTGSKIKVQWNNDTYKFIEVTPSNSCGQWNTLIKFIETDYHKPEPIKNLAGNFSPCETSLQLYYAENLRESVLQSPKIHIDGGELVKDSGNYIFVRWNASINRSITIADSNTCGWGSSTKWEINDGSNNNKPVVFITNGKIISSEVTGVKWYENGQEIENDNGFFMDIQWNMAGKYYFVQVNNECGASVSEAQQIVLLSAEQEHSATGLNVANLVMYPTPAKDKIYISTSEGSTMPFTHVNIYSLLGEMLMEFRLEGTDAVLDVSPMKDGIYLMDFIGNERKETRRLVIQK